MKFTQRLDYGRLAEVLAEREMAAVSAIQELLQASNEGGQPFPEALVTANLVADWDLSRVVCEVFHLPFLPVDQAAPDKDLLELFHPSLLHSTGLVPVSKYGNVLTIAMPGLVAADTLALLSAETDMVLLPLVGTVNSNRKWLTENCAKKKVTEDAGWGNLFDEGDKAVQETLGSDSEEAESLFSMDEPDSGDALDLAGDLAVEEGLDLETSGLEFEADDLEVVPSLAESGDSGASLLDELDDALGIESTVESGGESDGDDEGPVDLPPMPEF